MKEAIVEIETLCLGACLFVGDENQLTKCCCSASRHNA